MIILGFVISIRIILCTYFTTLCAAGCVNLPPLPHPNPPQCLIHLTQPSLCAGVCLRNGGCVVIVVVVVVCRVTRIVIVQIKYVTTRPLHSSAACSRCLLTVLCDSRVPLRPVPPRTATDSETRPLLFASVCVSKSVCVCLSNLLLPIVVVVHHTQWATLSAGCECLLQPTPASFP